MPHSQHSTVILNKGVFNHFWIQEGGRCIWRWWVKEVFKVKRKDKWVALKKIEWYDKHRLELEIFLQQKYAESWWVPAIYDIQVFEWNLYIFEEFLDWKNLLESITEIQWNIEKVKRCLSEIIRILTPFWEDNNIHRDIKPENIMLVEDKLYVLDFWIARVLDAATHTLSWVQPKTIQYAWPELLFAKKERLSIKTDFFSLWVLGYVLFYWKFPFWDCPEEIYPFFEQNWRYNPKDKFKDSECKLTNFFQNTMCYMPSDRVWNIEDLYNLIQ